MVEYQIKERHDGSYIYYVWPEKRMDNELIVEFVGDDIKILNAEYTPDLNFYLSHVWPDVYGALDNGKEPPSHGIHCWY